MFKFAVNFHYSPNVTVFCFTAEVESVVANI